MSEWTVDTLKQHLDELRTVDKEAVDIALAAAKEAVAIAEANAEKWRDNANEWRGAMNDRERDFMRRSEVRAFFVAVIAVLAVITPVIVLAITR